MIDTEKEYWFAFEPYIHITLKEKAALLYNTLDGEYIKATDEDELKFIAALLDKKNCGVTKRRQETSSLQTCMNVHYPNRSRYNFTRY